MNHSSRNLATLLGIKGPGMSDHPDKLNHVHNVRIPFINRRSLSAKKRAASTLVINDPEEVTRSLRIEDGASFI